MGTLPQSNQCKRRRSVNISWLKGHATQYHIDREIISFKNNVGNDTADEIADIGTALFGKDVMLAAKCFYKRHDNYQQFMIEVSHHIVEGYLIGNS